MNGPGIAAIAAIPSAILVVLIVLTLWHWLESGEGATVGIKMGWQDVRVAFSCRSVDTTFRFIARKYEDFVADRIIFAAPGWKRFICPVYETDVPRTDDYRRTLKASSYEKLTEHDRTRLDAWLEARDLTLSTWYPADG